MAGVLAAFWAEAAIAFVLLSVVLRVSASRFERFTGVAAGLLIWLYIAIEAPVSGMSMNPARSFGPAVAAGTTGSLWIYFTAPPAGMLLAAEMYLRRYGLAAVRCAKMHHPSSGRCIFNCAMSRP
jgi:aquaporin Z